MIVLPNSKNVQLAAEEAAKLSSKEAVVVPTVSQQGALAPWSSSTRHPPSTRSAWQPSFPRSGSAGLRRQARDDVEGRFAVGEAVG